MNYNYYSMFGLLLSDNKRMADDSNCASRERMQLKSSIRTFLVILLTTIGFSQSFAQSAANYTYSTATNGSLALDKGGNTIDMSSGTTQLYGGNIDGYTATLNNIGFNFVFMGNIYSQFSCNPDGQIRLGSLITGHASSAAAGVPLLIANNADGKTDTTGKVHYKVQGVAPNRVMIIEWKDVWIWYNTTTTTFSTYQARVYEDGTIEYVYGRMFNNNSAAQTSAIGFSSSNTAGTVGQLTTINTTPVYNTASTSYTSTSFAANADMANLNSTANGSRRVFTFTPTTTVAPASPTSLTFTAVTTSGITPNWVDNSTNEIGFSVVRATDAGFTQNVVSTFVPTTTSASTGTSYSSPQTGLVPGTTYFFRIVATTEGLGSPGLTGSQATADAATYYWVGTTGGSWSTATSWNTAADNTGLARTTPLTTDVLIIDGDGTTAGAPTTIIVDLASFSIGQFKITNNTACTLQSSITTTRVIMITGGPGEDFVIENGSTLNLTHAANPVAFAFSGSGHTGIISGTYNASGSTSNTITTTGGTGTLVSVTATGVVNNTITGSSGCMLGSVATLSFANGASYTHGSFTTTNGYIPLATWDVTSSVTITGGTTSTGITNNNQSFGHFTYNSATSTGTMSVWAATTTAVVKGNLNILATNTGIFRATTTGYVRVLGNLNVIGGTFQVGNGTASINGVDVAGSTTIGSNGTLNLNAAVLSQSGSTFINDGILTGTATGSHLYLYSLTNAPQIFSGTGTVLTNIASLSVDNLGGVTITHDNQIPTLRVNLFGGTVTNSNKITIGTGAALATIVQIGATGLTTAGGSFDVSPVFNLGTGAYTVTYQHESVGRTSGFEIPASRSVTNLTLNNVNGLTLTGGNLEVSGSLALTLGTFTTDSANVLSLGTALAAGTLTGGSATSYIRGPFVRTINSGNLTTNYILFPVGKVVYAPISLAPSTTSVSRFSAETFNTNTGTAAPSIMNLSATRRWEAPLVSGAFDNINVRIGDASLVSTNIIAQAPAANGAYATAFGSTAVFATGTPNTITSNTTANSANYTGFLSFAESNLCTGTPAPGNTIASANAICLGQSVALSLQNTTPGSGVTYQWKFSTDGGVVFNDVAGATNATLNVTPSVPTFYYCTVTCSSGPSSFNSNSVEITFTNAIVTTTPASICGAGSATLAATGSTGTTINWYTAATGGIPVGTGSTFTTPTISVTTDYYAAAETGSPGISVIGLGATNSASVGQSFFPGSWGGAKTQYIIRASELKQAGFTAGAFSSLGFEPTTSGQTYQGFYVNLGLTTAMVAPTSTFIDTGLTQVYAGTLADDGFVPVAGSVNTLVFGTGTNSSSTFVWDGTSNIVVSISWSRVPAATTATSSTMKVDNVGFAAAAYRQRDNLTPAAMLAETSVNTTTTFRPRFTINGQLVCSSPRSSVTATVTTPPAFTLSTASTDICNGQSTAAVTISTGAADYDTYVWSPSTGVTGNATTGWIFNPSATTTYTLTASQSGGALCSTSASVTVTVNPIPSSVTITPAASTTCLNAVTTLSTTGGTIGSTGSNTIGTATTLTGATAQPTAFCNRFKHYWIQIVYTAAELNAAGVQAGNINAVKFNITTLGDGTNVTDLKVRMGSTGSSTLSSFQTTGLTLVKTSATYNHVIGINTLTFDTPYVWDGISNIILDMRQTGADITNNSQTYFTATTGNTSVTAVTSTVNAGGSDGFAASSPSATVSVNRLNTTFDWSSSVPTNITWSPVTDLYTDAAATVAYVANANANTVYFKSSTVGGPTTYTATATSGSGCTSTATTEMTVNPNATIVLTSGSATQTVCVNSAVENIVYTLTDATGATTSGLPAGVTGVFNAGVYTLSGTPTIGGTFNYTVTPTGCGSATLSGTITVNSSVAPSAPATQSFCNSATVAELTASGTIVNWYTTSTGGTALTANDALTSTDYYVSQTTDGCESPRTTVTVTITVASAPTAAAQTFCNSATVGDLTATGSNIKWYADAVGGSALGLGTALSTATLYVSQTVNGCESTRTSVAVTVNTTNAPTGSSTQSFTEGQTIADISVTGSNIVWYATAADAAAGTNALPSTTLLVDGTTYYATQTANGCTSTNTLDVTVTVTLGNGTFNLEKLSYYPNPVVNVITVTNTNEISKIELFDVLGRSMMIAYPNATIAQIDMSNLPQATYMMHVTSEGQFKVVKVLKK